MPAIIGSEHPRKNNVAARGRWRIGELKLEAGAFLLVILTFAGLLWGDYLRERSFDLTGSLTHLVPYTYSDANDGGSSTAVADAKVPLQWTCYLAGKVQYPYCAYGLKYDASGQGEKALDLSSYDEVDLHLDYKGPPTRLKLTFKNFVSAHSKADVVESTMPVVADFEVRPGVNKISLHRSQFMVEQWWLTERGLTEGAIAPEINRVAAVDVVSAAALPIGRFSVKLRSIVLTGTIITATQWYLMLLSAWAVIAGALLVYRFLSVRREYELRHRRQARESRELAIARAAAEAASDAKTQFLANMSHELRTPLNGILGYAQLLERSDLSERQRSAVNTIRQSGTHLLTLITDILDLSKIEAGKLDLLPAPFDLKSCIAHVGDMVRLNADEKGLTFSLQISDDVPNRIIGDAKRVRQILLNLLSNAVKFTDQGEVRLEVSVASWIDGNVRLRMDVVDTGPGIHAQDVERLFKAFEQAGTAKDRSGGTGLGLSITRQLVRAMNGEIRVESTPGSGTRFKVEVEGELASAWGAGGGAAAMPLVETEQKVLVVDDDPLARRLLCDALRHLGSSPIEAEDCAVVVRQCAQLRPDILLIDVKIPSTNGLAVIRQLKAEPRLRDIAIIAVSEAVSATLECDALSAGAVSFLSKPVDVGQLSQAMARLRPAAVNSRAAATVGGDLSPPPEQWLRLFHGLARAGNMRVIERQANELAAQHPEHNAFARRLSDLARSFQSPAILRMIEANLDSKLAA